MTRPKSKAPVRNRELGVIHQKQKQLGLDEVTYRELLQRVGGVDSSADLDTAGRRKVMDEMTRLAGGKAVSYPGKPNNVGSEPLLQKVEALLADMKLAWSYADAILKRQTAGVVERCQFANAEQLRGVITALVRKAGAKK